MKMKLLVAEDHPKLARSIADGLREEGYCVDLTLDGSEASHLISSNEYDCVILDIMLPGKEGWAILEDARGGGRLTPVLCLTARDAPEDRVRGLDLGADDYLIKPFDWDELLARVRALIRRSHGRASTLLRIDDLEINTAGKTVQRRGMPIALSAREYGLLHYLAMRAGQVVSRREVSEHLYDNGEGRTSNVVDVYVGYLRNKIDKPFDVKLIHTRRGQGYMLGSVNEAGK